MFGFSFEKFIVIAVFAILILGPDRLPAYAAKLATFVTALRRMADGAKDRMRDEVGPDFDDVDWKKLDPRQYDPRHIIRQALFDVGSADGERPESPAATDVDTARNPVRPLPDPSQSP